MNLLLLQTRERTVARAGSVAAMSGRKPSGRVASLDIFTSAARVELSGWDGAQETSVCVWLCTGRLRDGTDAAEPSVESVHVCILRPVTPFFRVLGVKAVATTQSTQVNPAAIAVHAPDTDSTSGGASAAAVCTLLPQPASPTHPARGSQGANWAGLQLHISLMVCAVWVVAMS